MTDLFFLLDTTAGFGRGVFGWAIAMNIFAGLLVLGCLLCDRVLAHKVSPGIRIGLYTVVLIRLALPVNWAAPALSLLPAPAQMRVAAPGPALPQVHLGVPHLASPAETPAPEPATAVDVLGVLLALAYVGGVVSLSLWWAQRTRRLNRALTAATPARATWRGLAPDAELFEHPHIGPLVTGVRRPRIIVPTAALEELATNTLALILRHEAAHLARRDHLLAPALLTIAIVAWPVVAAWIALSRVRALMEQACDERALHATDTTTRKNYAEAMLDLASPRLGMAGPLCFGAGVSARIRAMRPKRRFRTLVQVSLVAPLMVLLLACAGAQPAAKAPADHAAVAAQRSASQDEGPQQIRLAFRVLSGWPDHPKLKWDLNQIGAGSPQNAPPVPSGSTAVVAGTLHGRAEIDPAHTLTSAEVQQVLATPSAGYVLAAPTLQVLAGQRATIRVGENDAEGAPVSGFAIAATPSVADGSVQIDFDFEEFAPEPNRKSLKTIAKFVPTGQTVAHLATAMSGGTSRVLLISAEVIRPADHPASAPLPRVMFMTNLFELDAFIAADAATPGEREVLVMGDLGKGGKVVASGKTMPGNTQIKDGWACLVPESQVRAMFDAVYQVGRARLISAPATVTPAGEWASVGPTDKDKPGAPFGLRLQVQGTPTPNDQVATTLRLARPDGTPLVNATVQVSRGQALLCLVPPSKEGEKFRLLVVRPSLIRTEAEYPYQTSSFLSPSPAPPTPPASK